MKFEELKKSLKENKKNNYLLIGEDNFLLDRAYNLILDAYNIEFKDLNLIKFSLDQLDFENVVKALNTLPAFSDKKMVFVDMSTKLSKIMNLKSLEGYIEKPNEFSVLVIKVATNLAQFPNTKGYEIIDCSRLDKVLIKKFIDNEVMKYNKKLSIDAFNLLYEYTNGDMTSAINEIIKLNNFVGDREIIEVDDVNEITTKTIEFQIYEITESLGKKDAKKVFMLLEELKNRKDGYRGILSLIYNHFRRLLHISLNTNETKSDLAKMLGVKEFAITKASQQLKYFNKKKLKSICDMCIDLDYKTKRSMVDLNTAVEMLVLKILE